MRKSAHDKYILRSAGISRRQRIMEEEEEEEIIEY